VPAKILVVEDHSDSREMLTTILEDEGFSVISAEDGQSGLDLANSERPDLIITDIEMPNMNGLQMIERLRARPEFAKVPILVLTAYGLGTSDDAVRAGANGSVPKPLQLNSFIRLVTNLLSYVPSLVVLVYAGGGAFGV